jgi:hypothetical protein
MQSITTKYLGPTNSRGSRIKASCSRGSITVPYEHGIDTNLAHRRAFYALLLKFKTEDETEYGKGSSSWSGGRWVQGDTDTGYVFVAVKDYATFEVPE